MGRHGRDGFGCKKNKNLFFLEILGPFKGILMLN
jgi:hypothetical protein